MTLGNAQLAPTALAIVTWGVDIWFRRRSCAPPLPRFPLYSLRQYYKHAYRSLNDVKVIDAAGFPLLPSFTGVGV